MLHNRSNPKGVDLYIQRVQNEIYNKMIATWPFNVVYDSYGRCYRNNKNGKYFAEVYNPSAGLVMNPNSVYVFTHTNGISSMRVTALSLANAVVTLGLLVAPAQLSSFSLTDTIRSYSAPGENEYVDPLWNDKAGVVSFFGVDDLVKNETQRSAKVHFIVMCNLKKLYPDLGDRADENIKNDMLNLFGKALYGFFFESFDTGMDNCFKEYRGSAEQMKKNSMHPLFVFRLNFSLHYNHNFSPSLKLNSNA